MMMMEERKKFVCKYCSKRFPCGKSLGGHIRTHITEERTTINASSSSPIAANTHDLLLKKKRKRDSPWPTQSSAAGTAANNNNSPTYGLRENPKKTTRFVHIDGAAATNLARDKEERFCKECGKGFPSMKALCGHMACHSDKDKDREKFVVMAMDDDDADDDEYGDNNNSQSDAESSGAAAAASLLPRRRSKRMMRFKNLRPFCSSSPSASVSEVEQQQEEQEEVARMLMMLSRDSGRKGRLPSLTESSDNNSVVLDTNKVAAVAVSYNNHNNNNGRKNFVPNDSDSAVGSLRSVLKNKMADSDVSMDEFKGWKNVKDKERRSKYSSNVGFAATVKDLEYETRITTTTTTRKKFDFRKRANYDSLIHSSTEVPAKNDEYDDCSYDSTEYDDVDEDEESDENSTDTDSFPAPKAHSTKASTKANKSKKNMKKKKTKLKLKKSKEHECPICYKIFKSGQALGGHKRSHFIGGSSEENTLVIKQHHAPPPSLVVVPNCLIDLNLPAPVDD